MQKFQIQKPRHNWRQSFPRQRSQGHHRWLPHRLYIQWHPREKDKIDEKKRSDLKICKRGNDKRKRRIIRINYDQHRFRQIGPTSANFVERQNIANKICCGWVGIRVSFIRRSRLKRFHLIFRRQWIRQCFHRPNCKINNTQPHSPINRPLHNNRSSSRHYPLSASQPIAPKPLPVLHGQTSSRHNRPQLNGQKRYS